MKGLYPLDLVQNELRNATIQNLSTAPTSPAPIAGQFYFDTTQTHLYVYNGATWEQASGASGSGSVTTVSVATANGFAGTVADATSTPIITLTTSVTGMLKGNGTAMSAGTAGTDYMAPSVTSVSTATSGNAYEFQATDLTSGNLLGASVPSSGFTGNLVNFYNNAGTPAALFVVSAAGAITTGTIAGASVTGTVGLANGGTGANLASTGGSKELLQQASSGADVTVATIDHTFISDWTTAVEAFSLDEFTAPAANVSFNSHRITSLADPSSLQDAATMNFVLNAIAGICTKSSAHASTTAALPANTYNNGTSGVGATLTGNANGALAAQDGVTLSLNDYLLVQFEAAQANNGLYQLTTVGTGSTPYVLTRAAVMDLPASFPGALIYVEAGTTYATTQWACSLTSAPTIGTTAITFSQFAGPGSYSFSAPLSASGTTISLNLDARLVNNGGSLDLASGIVTAGTYTSVTVDTYGRVTAGADIVSTNGVVSKTAAGTFAARTITGTSSQIDVSNGNGVSGNPTISIDTGYVGQTSITTLGTIGTGTWQGTAVAVGYGGTGASSASGARSNLNAAGRYVGTITGDGSTTSFTITQSTHGLAVGYNMIATFDGTTNERVYPQELCNPSNGTVTINFSVAPAVSYTYNVLLVG